MKTALRFLFSVSACWMLMLTFSAEGNAQDVPDEARRHYVRGETAVEVATRPGDYDEAVTEFLLAAELAPLWADPYYQLALVYEKAEKFPEAVAGLKKYLELTPDAPNAGEIKDQIYKLEYKAEHVVTRAMIIDMLCTGFLGWTENGEQPFWPYFFFTITEKAGPNSVRIHGEILNNSGGLFNFADQTVEVTGPIVRFNTWVNECSDPGDRCEFNIENEIEVVSKTKVLYRQKIIPVRPNSRTNKEFNRSCEYTKPN